MNILEFINGTVSAASLNEDVTLTNAVDLSKSAIIMIQAHSGGGGEDSLLKAEFIDANTARFSRDETNQDADFQAIVVSIDKLVSLQFGSVPLSVVTSATASITPVDSVNNRVYVFESTSAAVGGSGFGSSLNCLTTFTPSTTMNQITATRKTTAGVSNCNFFVVELKV